MKYGRTVGLLVASGLVSIVMESSLASEPTVRNVDVRGLQVGGRTTVTIDGADFGTNPRLLLPWPQAQVTLKPGGTPQRASFDIELPADVTPGIEQFRVVTDEGLSSPQVMGVDHLLQVVLAPQVAALPVALHSTVNGSNVVESQFSGKAGDELTVEVESQRLGAKLRPVLHLLDANRRQIAWSWPQRSLFGDTRLTVKLPAEGNYFVQVHDAEYAAPAPSYFRIKLGQFHHAEVAFPPAIVRGHSQAVELIGHLPTGRVEVVGVSTSASKPVPWPNGALPSGLRVPLIISDISEQIELSTKEAPQDLGNLPVAVSGRILEPNEQDRYRISVEAGAKLRFEVLSERLGAPLDAVLVVQDDKGAVLARADDSPGSTDPVLDYTVAANLSHVVLVVSDQAGRGSPAAVYRLVASVAVDAANAADFRLLTPLDRITVAAGNRAVLPVLVERRGYEGPIRLGVDGAPMGVTIEGLEIPAGQDGTLVAFASTTVAPATRIALRGSDSQGQRKRDVVMDSHPLGDLQPWLRTELAAVVTPPHALLAEWGPLSSDAALVLAGKITLPIRWTRPEGEPTAVRLSLLTGQNVPRVNNNPDLNKAIRVEKPIEIAPDKSDGELPVLVPPELTGDACDVAVLVELLSKDKKTVVATSVSPPRRLAIVNPVGFELTSSSLNAQLDAKTGATVPVTGKVVRRAGFTGDVTLTATGQPGGVKADKVVVKAGTDEFTLPIVFPAGFKPGDVTSIRLSASGVPDATKPNQTVKTKDIGLTIRLSAAS